MRQVHLDYLEADNEIYKISFYSSSEGYVAFRDWIGFTQDTGHTFARKPITLSNVDYNGYGVNITFGFGIRGVKAFDRNTLIVYGDYGLVPAILHSTNGGNTFKLVYHSQFNNLQLRTGILDMVFPENNSIGYAVDADRILKTTDKGNTWTVSSTNAGSYFDHLEAVDNNNVFAFSTNQNISKLVKTSTAGSTWLQLNLPARQTIRYANFLSSSKGWLSTSDGNGKGYLYYTTNGGSTWTLKNNPAISLIDIDKMKFINDSVGFALVEKFETFKTSDAGKTWEPLSRDNNFSYLEYSHNDIYILDGTQIWSGGGHGFLELNTNTGARPLPKAYFVIDTTNIYLSNRVQLKNHSKPDYQYQWWINNVLVNDSFHTTYLHDIYRKADTIKLIVSNGIHRDTATKIHLFDAVPYPKPEVLSYFPLLPAPGSSVVIKGNYFSEVKGVSFGGIPARSYTVNSLTQITAVVGEGGNGNIDVVTETGTGTLSGFIMYPPPVIRSFAPLSAPVGAAVTITGSNFKTGLSENIVYFGSVRAQVLKATVSQLTVTVPAGATYDPITVTTNRHTAYSSQRFSVTFPSTCNFSEYTFEPKKKQPIAFGSNHGYGDIVIKDMDGDGRNDIISLTSDGIALSRNLGSPGVLEFEANINVKTGGGSGGVAVGDLDGDGKPDLAVTNRSNNTVSLLRNTSTIGNISFAPKVDLPTGGGPASVAINDLDGDGKPDIAVLNRGINVNNLTIFRNNSLPGTISFSRKEDMKVGLSSIRIQIGDLDNDGKGDLFVVDGGILNAGLYSFSIYRNNSTIGSISFDGLITIKHHSIPVRDGHLADMDGDGKLDISLVYDLTYTINENNAVAIYRNTSTPGTVALEAPVSFRGCSANGTFALGDLDGDGRIDLFGACNFNTNVLLMKNTSTPGSISMLSVNSPYMIMSGYSHANAIADLDGDSKPDLLSQDNLTSVIALYRNNLGERGALAGKDTTICQGQPIQLGQPSLAGYTYQWNTNPAGFTSTIANPVVSPALTTTYYLNVTNTQGCRFADTIRVQVGGPAPLTNAGIDRSACLGDTIRIGSAGTNKYKYSWSSIPAGFSSVEANPLLVPPVGTHSYILSVHTETCVAKDTLSVYVYSRPVANAGQDRSVCLASGTMIGTAAQGNNTYSWTSVPAGYASTTANPWVYPQVNTFYILMATNSVGCSSSDTVLVTTKPIPQAPAFTASGPLSFCAGGAVTLSTTISSGLQWFRNGSAIPGATTQALQVTEPGNYMLRTSNGTCHLFSAAVAVTVNANLPVPVIVTNGSTTFCQGGSVRLTSSIASGNQWFKDGVAIAGAVNQAYTADQAGNYTVKLTSGNCTSAFSNAVAVNVNANAATPVITAGGATANSVGGQVVLTSSATSGNQWYRNDTVISGGVNREYVATQSGRYSVRVGQGDCLSSFSSSVSVMVSPATPIPTITAEGSTLTSSATSGNQWYLNGAPIAGATTQKLTVQANGVYTVGVSQNGCSALSAPFNYTITSIATPAAWNNEVVVFPNPVKEQLYIDNKVLRKLSVQLVDRLGKLLLEKAVASSSSSIPVNGLAAGTYFLLITDKRTNEKILFPVIKL